jgi:catechol 2,3-dioxygenase-like lactoylglutathione lyase family enzyme
VPSLKRIDNLDILCSKVGPMVDFYHGVLGLPFLFPRDGHEDWAAIEAGNLTIYIFETAVGEHAPRRTPINPENPPGFDSFAFEVDDLDAAISDLEGQVAWASDEIIKWEHPSGTWYRYRPFYDPEGNMLYVTEPHKAAPG